MDCNYVKNILPEYLAGKCSLEEKQKISKHISSCPQCMRALEELEEPILKSENCYETLDTSKLLGKARKALLLKVIITTILSVMMLISIFFVIVPSILKTVNYPKISDVTRALVDITQFTSPVQVGGYGNSLSFFGEYSFDASAYTYTITGTKQKNSAEIKGKYNMFTGNFQSPVQPSVQFIHPNIKVSDEFSKKRSPAIAKNNLIKNGNNTVAVVDISLKSVKNLEEVSTSLKDFDVKVEWMAVECGSEGLKPKNINSSQNQYVQWGIPGQLFNTVKTGPSEFDYSSPYEYKKAVIEELKWLDKNKNYIAPDKSLLKFQGLDNSVENRAKYIIDNGIKIYGLRITGPSTELSKLNTKLDIRMEEVVDIDFYYWK